MTYPVVDTAQTACYGATSEITAPAAVHDAALAELSSEMKTPAEADPYVSQLPWLDASDSATPHARSPQIAHLKRTAVEKLLATL